MHTPNRFPRAARRTRLLAAILLPLAVFAPLAMTTGCGGDTASGETASGPAPTMPLPVTRAPQFVGVGASEVLPQKRSVQEKALRAQAKAGVGTLRQTFLWQEIEPKKGKYTWGMHDRLVASAAKAGITLMPIVFGVRPGAGAKAQPGAKVTGTTTMPPKSNAEFARYATVLVKRYGPGGKFWLAHPTLKPHPPTAWQIWNEPNLPPYWGGKVNPSAYGALLKTTAAAVRAADPQAEIVTGGVPESKIGMPLKAFVQALVQTPAKDSFDTLAVHPYAADVSGVLGGVERAKAVLDGVGLTNVNLRITEVGWATGSLGSDFTVSEGRQAELVAELLQRTGAAAAELRLKGVVYYGWRDVPPYPGGKDFWGLHTGLMTKANKPKPSLATFTAAARALRDGQ